MNYHLDHSTLIVDDQHKQFIFTGPDSSTVFLTFDKLAELNTIVHRHEEEMAVRKGQEWTTIKVYRNSANIPIDIELVQDVLAKVKIAYQLVASVHPEELQVQQKDLSVVVGIINRLGYETNKDSEE